MQFSKLKGVPRALFEAISGHPPAREPDYLNGPGNNHQAWRPDDVLTALEQAADEGNGGAATNQPVPCLADEVFPYADGQLLVIKRLAPADDYVNGLLTRMRNLVEKWKTSPDPYGLRFKDMDDHRYG